MRNCDIEAGLDDVMARITPGLRKKLEHSAELLRKAEGLAMAYDKENGYFLAFSGGKDSQCLYHVAKLAGVRFKAHMNLTSVDPPEVIRFVKEEYPDVELVKPKDSIFNIAARKKFLPTMRVRWCCKEYKENAGAGKVTLIGIRHQESARRAKRNEVEIGSRKFSGTLEELDTYREERAKRKYVRKKGSVNITNADGERVLGCISGKESLLISPIIEWTEQDVWGLLKAVGASHCSLYDEGWTRIGCINCPMSSRRQKINENKRWPHVKRNWLRAIKKARAGGDFQGYLWRAIPDCTQLRGGQIADEDFIAEQIYDYWITGKAFNKWFAEKFQQKDLFDGGVETPPHEE